MQSCFLTMQRWLVFDLFKIGSGQRCFNPVTIYHNWFYWWRSAATSRTLAALLSLLIIGLRSKIPERSIMLQRGPMLHDIRLLSLTNGIAVQLKTPNTCFVCAIEPRLMQLTLNYYHDKGEDGHLDKIQARYRALERRVLICHAGGRRNIVTTATKLSSIGLCAQVDAQFNFRHEQNQKWPSTSSLHTAICEDPPEHKIRLWT